VWDGAQWHPVAVREAAFGAFKKAGEGVPTRDTIAVGMRPATPSPLMQAPSWGGARPATAKKGIPIFAYVGGGAVAALLVVALILGVLPRLMTPAQTGSNTPVAKPSVAPGPSTRSESAKAAFVVSTLAAPMANLKDDMTQVGPPCRAGMTTSCEEALLATSTTLSSVVPVLQKMIVATCVAAPQNRLVSDLNATNAGVQLALKAFKDGKKTEFTSGVKSLTTYAARTQTDYVAIKTASATCNTDVVGP
jgi:hypothetical protein